MSHTPYLIWYVENPAISAEFYARLLGKPAVESSPTFALFVLDNGMKLGFWLRSGVIPEVQSTTSMQTCSGEFGLALQSKELVDQQYRALCEQGFHILLEPVMLDFGYTFVVCDPDGHRLRIFAPND